MSEVENTEFNNYFGRSKLVNNLYTVLQRVFHIINTNKGLIILGIVFFMALGITYCNLVDPVYRANAMIQLEQDLSDSQGINGGGRAASLLLWDHTKVEIEIIRSRSVLSEVVKQLGLQVKVSPKYLPIIGCLLAKRLKEKSNKREYQPFLNLTGYAWGDEKISVGMFEVPENLEGKEFVLISMGQGRFILKFGKVNILYGRVGEFSASESGDVRLFISNFDAREGARFFIEKEPLIKSIENVSSRLKIIRKGKRTGILKLFFTGNNKMENQSILTTLMYHYLEQNMDRSSYENVENINFFSQQLFEVKKKLERAEIKFLHFQMKYKNVGLIPVGEAILDSLVSVDYEIEKLKMQRKMFFSESDYREQDSVMASISEQLDIWSRERFDLVLRLKELSSYQQQLIGFIRDIRVLKLMYSQLSGRIQELKMMKGNIRILDQSLSELDPIYPNTLKIVLMSVFLGLVLIVSTIYYREYLAINDE